MAERSEIRIDDLILGIADRHEHRRKTALVVEKHRSGMRGLANVDVLPIYGT